MNNEEIKKTNHVEIYFFLGLLTVFALLSFFVFLPFLTTLILAATVAVITHPYYERILKRCGGRKSLASFLTIIVLVVLILIPITLIATTVFTEASGAYSHLSTSGNSTSIAINNLQQGLDQKLSRISPGFTINISDYISRGSVWVLANVGLFFSSTLAIGFKLFLGIFALFYFLKDGKLLIESIHHFSPLPREHNNVLFDKLWIAIRSIIGGSLIVGLIQGVVAGVGYWVFGVPNPALWGTITGLASLVPGLGTSLISIPAVIFLFSTGSTAQAVGLLIWWIFGVSLIDNFLVPRILGRGLNIHPLIILFAIIGGLAFFGPVGFLLGPLTIAFLYALVDLYNLVIKPKVSSSL